MSTASPSSEVTLNITLYYSWMGNKFNSFFSLFAMFIILSSFVHINGFNAFSTGFLYTVDTLDIVSNKYTLMPSKLPG